MEFALLRRLVDLGPRESVLDVGCGTGYFTTLFARETAGMVVGLDPNLAWLGYAAREGAPNAAWAGGRAETLPFPARSFDVVLSVTALCFIENQLIALREMLRLMHSKRQAYREGCRPGTFGISADLGKIRTASSPPSARLRRIRLPPWASATLRAMVKPSPVPPVSRLREPSTR
jgi:SAM-dependent methyltransferase